MSSKVTKVTEDQQKLIAIDYDGTITADVEMWIEIIKIIIARGHEVVIATMHSTYRLTARDHTQFIHRFIRETVTDKSFKPAAR